ncbi:MAG TPA: prepilin-type N-terminal cleavage/methylation domain-containing protein [Methylococcaceae bacterium]|nr:prepilin-type N-terminal cleavage/methylation domain-containing protein [Methylococcaceae bacterium]HIA44729.1 prepilin-type N-terminal cleavage/methylation domain-containing protein [Methylococcaceae bacterium]HIB77631.1 prepilin-type N-terminal cleavage/methylation domain-containing protein [Flavobacteriales bacterium]HIN76230.1 prepilin-type N-terminal cleavage/methylation domain-containing protein [Rhodospirillales bacterium]
MMEKILPNKVQGFSLVETLIAAVIVAVAMLGLGKLQGITLLNSADSRMKTHALNLAQEKIEALRMFANQSTYTGLVSGPTVSPDLLVGANANFDRTWEISSCPSLVVTSTCKKVSVEVKWLDPKGIEQTVQLTSYIAEADPVKSGVVLM